MQLTRRVIRTRRANDQLTTGTPLEPPYTSDWIEGDAERAVRNRFDLLLEALERVEGSRHDGWQPIVARADDGTKSTRKAGAWPSP